MSLEPPDDGRLVITIGTDGVIRHVFDDAPGMTVAPGGRIDRRHRANLHLPAAGERFSPPPKLDPFDGRTR